jgi:hypothetical protein
MLLAAAEEGGGERREELLDGTKSQLGPNTTKAETVTLLTCQWPYPIGIKHSPLNSLSRVIEAFSFQRPVQLPLSPHESRPDTSNRLPSQAYLAGTEAAEKAKRDSKSLSGPAISSLSSLAQAIHKIYITSQPRTLTLFR